MSYEIWIFDGKPRNGGLKGIETPPRTYGLKDAEAYAVKLVESYAAEGVDVTAQVRMERSY